MRYTLLCAVAAACLACPSAFAAGPVVSAFYYPWFGTNTADGTYLHWAQHGHVPPNDIDSTYYPTTGPYSSADPNVLSSQMAEIERAGINQLAVSWWGKGSPEDQRLAGVVRAARAHDIAIALHIEPYTGRTVATVGADITYLRGLGITTYYLYQPFTIAPQDWAGLNDTLIPQGITIYAQTAFIGQAVTGHFSGIYTYDILTWDAAKLARLCTQAHTKELLCAPSVGPGYDAQRATGDPHVKQRSNGATYDSMWQAAIRAGADAITITSFNEWQEGTQIEPAAAARFGTYRYQGYDGAWGITGPAAETAYLDRTAYWSGLFRRVANIPVSLRAKAYGALILPLCASSRPSPGRSPSCRTPSRSPVSR